MTSDPWMFAERLNCAIAWRTLTQKDLASRANIAATTLSHFQSGQRQPSLANLRRLALALAVPSDYLLGLTHTIETSAATNALYARLQALALDDFLLVSDFVSTPPNRKAVEGELVAGATAGGTVTRNHRRADTALPPATRTGELKMPLNRVCKYGGKYQGPNR